MLAVSVDNRWIRIGNYFSVSFQRTLRIPDDGRTYPLPPGLGSFPIYRIEDFAKKVPASWVEHGGVFIPMYQREALWLSFSARSWHPNAVKIGIGKINAVSGKPWDQRLSGAKQDYVVCPDQPWLDGINAGKGLIRQFVAMPLGMGYTVEGQLTGKEEFGGIQIVVYDAKSGRFPATPPVRLEPFGRGWDGDIMYCCKMSAPAGMEMGLGAGGRMTQKIYDDDYGLDTWDEQNFGRAYVHIVNSLVFREITGQEPPLTPVSARTYTEHGFPWFALYDQEKATVDGSEELSGVKSVKEMDAQKGFGPQQDDEPVEVKSVEGLGKEAVVVGDGKW